MAQRLVLHVGTMKSGTSFLQNALFGNKRRLRRQGVLFPGSAWKFQARAVLEWSDRGLPGEPPLHPEGPWHKLVDAVNAHDGTAVVSMEFFGPRGRKRIRTLAEDFPGTRIEAVITVRDIGRNLPAMWQESMQNRGVRTWEEYVAGVRRGPTDVHNPGTWFWRQQGVAKMAARWADVLGHDNVTLVTVPQPGAPRDLLWERFCEAARIDGSECDLEVAGNPSIGLSSALMMRRLNENLSADPDLKSWYADVVKRDLVKSGLARRAKQEPKLGLDRKWVVKRGKQETKALKKLKLRLVGKYGELVPRPVPGASPDEVSVADELDAAVDGISHLIHAWPQMMEAKAENARQRAERQARRAASAQDAGTGSAEGAEGADDELIGMGLDDPDDDVLDREPDEGGVGR